MSEAPPSTTLSTQPSVSNITNTTNITTTTSSNLSIKPDRQQLVYIHHPIEGKITVKISEQEFSELDHNDSAVARLVVKLHAGHIKVDSETNEVSWWCSNGKLWYRKEEGLARLREGIAKLLFDYKQNAKNKTAVSEEDKKDKQDKLKECTPFLNEYQNASRLDAVVKRIKDNASVRVKVKEWDWDDMSIQLKGGWRLDLTTGHIRRSEPEDRMTRVMALGLPYVSTLPEMLTLWEQSLLDIFKGDVELIDRLGLAVYYTMTGRKNLKAFVLGVGLPDTAKSFVQEVIKGLLGEYAGMGDFSVFEAKSKKDLDTLYAYDLLHGVRMLAIDESSEDQVLDEQRIKQATGGTEVYARSSHGKPYRYVPKWTPWMSTNNFPTIRRNDEGTWKRLRVFPYDRVFEIGSSDRDERLKEKILESNERLSEVFLWVMGYREQFLREGLGTPTSKMVKAKELAREGQDYFGDFINECLVQAESDPSTVDEIYEVYSEWCKAKSHQRTKLNWTKFKIQLRERGVNPTGWRVR